MANVEVQTDAFVELLLFRVEAKNRLEQIERAVVIVTLQRLYASFVNRDCLEIG